MHRTSFRSIALASLLSTLYLTGCATEQVWQTTSADSPTTVILRNALIQATVTVPHAEHGLYRGVRFDPSGIVTHVEAFGHTFFGPWRKLGDGTGHDDIYGTAEEFDLDKALGYDEARVGESFVKIPVGVLRKHVDKKYAFGRAYPKVYMPAWQYRQGDDWIEFRQSLIDGPHAPGWGYDFAKRVTLDRDGVIITRSLINTGTNTIDLNHYGHNFIRIDDAPLIGPVYRIETTFPLEWKKVNKHTRRRMLLDGNRATLIEPITKGAIWGMFKLPDPTTPQHHHITVTHTETGGQVSIIGNTSLERLVVWGLGAAICPEPFVRIHLEPGQQMTWSTMYRFASAQPE